MNFIITISSNWQIFFSFSSSANNSVILTEREKSACSLPRQTKMFWNFCAEQVCATNWSLPTMNPRKVKCMIPYSHLAKYSFSYPTKVVWNRWCRSRKCWFGNMCWMMDWMAPLSVAHSGRSIKSTASWVDIFTWKRRKKETVLLSDFIWLLNEP